MRVIQLLVGAVAFALAAAPGVLGLLCIRAGDPLAGAILAGLSAMLLHEAYYFWRSLDPEAFRI